MIATALGITGATLGAPTAHAGTWYRTTCLNPDQSGAGSEGWTSFSNGTPPAGSTSKATCGPNDPMIAFLTMKSPALTGSEEVLQYAPPDGSTLAGGVAFVGLSADGYGFDTVSTAAMFTPAYFYDATNVFMECVVRYTPCQNGVPNYYGPVEIPPNRGGNLYLAAACTSKYEGFYCAWGGSHGAWSLVSLVWANLLLSTNAAPTATDFRGSLLEPAAHGTASLAFSAADTGPGVYRVIVSIDGKPVYDATPNTNAGKCVSVGTHNKGELMFQWQQPCPRSQAVDLSLKTTTLADGPHELKVVVMNAARDATTVLRRTITTNNRTTVSSTLTSDKVAVKPPLATPGVVTSRPAYSVVLDPPTQAMLRGVRRAWSRSSLSMSGTLRSTAGVPAPGVLVTLFAKSRERAAEAVARTTTDSAGHWVLTAPQGASRILKIVYGEQPDPESPLAISVRQIVKPNISLRVRPLGRGRLRFSGRVRIGPLPSPRPLVLIQTRNRAGKWQAVGSSLRVSRTGTYSIIYNGGPNVIGGSYAFRTVVHATSAFAAGVSPIRRTRVR